MSRRLGRSVEVRCDGCGVPTDILTGRACLTVCGVVDGWREWFGAAFGEPERDVWIVDTPQGVYELHCVYESHCVRVPGVSIADPAVSASDAPDEPCPTRGCSGQGHWFLERSED